MASLGELLDEALARRGLTLRAFSRLVNAQQPHLTEIRRGVRKVPKAHIAAWADALGLAGAEREDFLFAAALPHCPPLIRDLIAEAEATTGKSLLDIAKRTRSRH